MTQNILYETLHIDNQVFFDLDSMNTASRAIFVVYFSLNRTSNPCSSIPVIFVDQTSPS